MSDLSDVEPPGILKGKPAEWSGIDMKSKKPDVFLGVTMALLVLAVLLCIVILNTQKNKNEKESCAMRRPMEAPRIR